MARVLGPNNVPITPAIGGAPTRAGGESFGAQQAAAQQQAGHALQQVGRTAGLLADKRQDLEDADFLGRTSIALDEDFDASSLEEAGRLGSSERLRATFEKRPKSVIENLQSQGFNPSKEAVKRAELIGLQKASTHLRRNVILENNQRVNGAFENAATTVGLIGQRAAKTGDLTGGFAEVESVLAGYERALDPVTMRKLRENAAETLLGAFADRPEELESMLDAVTNPKRFGDVNPEARRSSLANLPTSYFDIPEAQRSRLPAGMRNNNPGNIKYTRGSSQRAGVVGPSENRDEGDPQLVFDTPQSGMDAMADLAQRKYRNGQTTAMALIAGRNGWTPGNQSAAANVARTLGRGPNDDLGLDDPDQLSAFLKALALQEHGPASKLYPDELYDAAAHAGGGARRDQLPDGFKGDLARVLLGNAGKIRAAVADRRRAQGLLSGEILADPGSKEDRDQIDNAMNSIQLGPRLRQADPSGAVDVTKVAVRAGFVPESALSPLRAMAANGNAMEQTYALQTAANILRVKPGALASEGAKTLRDDAVLFAAMSEAGMPDQIALTRLREMRTPEFKKMSEAREKEVGKVLKDTSAADLTSAFDVWYSSAPELGGSPREAGVVLDTYRDMVKYHYIRTGDADLAKGAAIQDLKGVMGVSEVAGKKRLMRYPPEQHLPRTESERPGLFAGTAGQRGDFKWFDEQLTESVEQISGKRIPLKDIFLEATPQTGADVRAGRDPTYGVVWFEERDGVRVMQTAPGMVFRADRQAAETKQTEMRKAWLEEERQEEIDRREKQPGRVREALKTLIDPSRALIEKDGNFYLDPAPQINFGQDEATKTKRKSETDAVRGGIRRFLHPEDALTPMERPKRDLTVKPSY